MLEDGYVAVTFGWAKIFRRIAASAVMCVLTLQAVPARADALKLGYAPSWVELWGASPQQPIDLVLGPISSLTLSGQTVREIVRVSSGGNMLRIRLSNEYTGADLTVGDVRVAVSAANGKASSATTGASVQVTFGGRSSVTLPPNAPLLSDPIAMSVGALESLAVSIFVSQSTAPATLHLTGQQTAYIAQGDQTAAESLPVSTATTTVRYLLTGVDAYRPKGGATIVTLGDSITDGFQSTTDANRRWPDFLAERLQLTSLRDLAISDQGISGGRLLSEGFGPSTLSRLDRDVLARPGLRYVTLLQGINDIGFPVVIPGASVRSAADLIGAYRQIIARVHDAGALIFGCTITPFKGANYYSAAGEQTRGDVNEFIRNSGEFDGVIDFDRATRNPRQPLVLLPAYDSGDHLHPNDDGYAAMADAVPLNLFRK